MSENASSGGDQTDDRGSSTNGYRWVCPACGATGLHPLSGQGRNALRALKTHVYFSDGDGHGEAETFPPDRPVESLGDHVGRAPVGETLP